MRLGFKLPLIGFIMLVLLVPILLWRSLTDHSLHGEDD